ncbi:MAG: tyrosine-type recombinase/integrase [Oscillospiraceae bacterium]|nr:tyrosine-type recombinase/integrase [Oscillospiraceae bacterium]
MLFNPAWRTYKYSGKRFSRPTADEKTAQTLIAALKEENIKYETYYKLLLSTGLILRKYGLPENLTVHSLRHTAASLMIANGTDVATVAGILGHSQVSTTVHIKYPHTSDYLKAKAA